MKLAVLIILIAGRFGDHVTATTVEMNNMEVCLNAVRIIQEQRTDRGDYSAFCVPQTLQ